DGYLHAGVDQHLEDGEGGQRGGADVEAAGGVDAGDAEAGTVHDRDEVDEDADPPHGGGPGPAGRVSGQPQVVPAGVGRAHASPLTMALTRLTCRRTTSA